MNLGTPKIVSLFGEKQVRNWSSRQVSNITLNLILIEEICFCFIYLCEWNKNAKKYDYRPIRNATNRQLFQEYNNILFKEQWERNRAITNNEDYKVSSSRLNTFNPIFQTIPHSKGRPGQLHYHGRIAEKKKTKE